MGSHNSMIDCTRTKSCRQRSNTTNNIVIEQFSPTAFSLIHTLFHSNWPLNHHQAQAITLVSNKAISSSPFRSNSPVALDYNGFRNSISQDNQMFWMHFLQLLLIHLSQRFRVRMCSHAQSSALRCGHSRSPARHSCTPTSRQVTTGWREK